MSVMSFREKQQVVMSRAKAMLARPALKRESQVALLLAAALALSGCGTSHMGDLFKDQPQPQQPAKPAPDNGAPGQ
ncbi:hypothetical protein [Aestuariivirga sp.]|uniref:hypothetical protein n=1 Tax=Aestuariivirga sp. TaxID=2650926 RepID=UPI0039E2DA52